MNRTTDVLMFISYTYISVKIKQKKVFKLKKTLMKNCTFCRMILIYYDQITLCVNNYGKRIKLCYKRFILRRLISILL